MTAADKDASDVAAVRGCLLPLGLLYDVEHHMWYEPLADGAIRIGMTHVAVALASHRIFAFTPRRAGRAFEAGKAVATIESSKWVGPARVAFDGVVATINEGLIDHPGWLAEEPYGKAWMITARPSGANPMAGLVTGAAAVEAYLAWMNASDFPGCEPEAT